MAKRTQHVAPNNVARCCVESCERLARPLFKYWIMPKDQIYLNLRTILAVLRSKILPALPHCRAKEKKKPQWPKRIILQTRLNNVLLPFPLRTSEGNVIPAQSSSGGKNGVSVTEKTSASLLFAATFWILIA